MKNKLILLIAAMITATAASAQTPEERFWKNDVEKIRFISYNICDGFDRQTDKERQIRLTEWVKSQDPEIIGLQELCGFDAKALTRLASSWGHPYSVLLKEKGYPVGISSKRPIEVKARLIDGYGHGLLHVKTYGIDILITHLSPHDPAVRRQEAQAILRYIRENHLEQKCLLAGDLNSCSPMDAEGLYSSRKPAPDYSVISSFISLPLIDICQKYVAPQHRETFPTPILMDVSKHKEIRLATSERRDYILLTPDLAEQAVDADIYNGPDTEYLSDHFPIAVDLFREREQQPSVK